MPKRREPRSNRPLFIGRRTTIHAAQQAMQTCGTIMRRSAFNPQRPFNHPVQIAEHLCETRHELRIGQGTDLQASQRRMHPLPMLGDIDAPWAPDPLESLNIGDEPLQPRQLAGAPDQTAMQADTQHLGRARLPLGIEHVETVLEILKKLLARDIARRGGKTHVIGLQRVGNDQLLARSNPHPSATSLTVFMLHRPVYHPLCRSPTTSVCRRIVSAIAARSSASDMSLCSIHFKPWLAISHPASSMASTCSGHRANAEATP